jgi:hypothetical protein
MHSSHASYRRIPGDVRSCSPQALNLKARRAPIAVSGADTGLRSGWWRHPAEHEEVVLVGIVLRGAGGYQAAWYTTVLPVPRVP